MRRRQNGSGVSGLRFLLVFGLIIAFSSLASPLVPINASEDTIPQEVIQRSVTVIANGLCGGVLIDKEHILTAAHCVRGSKVVSADDTIGETHHVQIIILNVEKDLALGMITPPSKAYTLSSEEKRHQIADSAYVGDEVWIVGAPAGELMMLLHGYIAKRSPFHFTNCDSKDKIGTAVQDTIWLDARIYYGSSGGGVFDIHGRLIGIVQRMASTGGGTCDHPTEDVGVILWGYAAGPQALVDFLGAP